MLSSVHLEDVAYRFQPFVGELRSFLKQSGVAYGFPEHLLSFTERLAGAGSLREGVSAKLLEVLRGLQQPVSHGELVELLLVAVGGESIDEDTPTVQKTERVLSQLVGEVMTSREGIRSLEHAAPEAHAVQQAKVVESTLPSPLDVAVPPPDKPGAAVVAISPANGAVEPLAAVDRAVLPTVPVDTLPPEIAIAPEQMPSRAVAWASPPAFLWAALVCGVLLPPCMYLLSRPHAEELRAPSAASAAAMHTGTRPHPKSDLVLPTVGEWKPLDLDFLEEPTPRKRSHKHGSHTGATHAAEEPHIQDVSSAVQAGSKEQSLGDSAASIRQTDKPGRDLGPAERVSSPQ